MKILGHAAGGWLAARILTMYMRPITRSERNKLLALGFVAGSLPDWDYSLYALKKGGIVYENDFQHHTWITHTIPFYALPSMALYLFGLAKDNRMLKNSAKVIFASTGIHLLQDMLGSGDGIMILYPFSKKMYGIGLSGLHGKEWLENYKKSPFYFIEKLFIFVAIITSVIDFFHRRSRK